MSFNLLGQQIVVVSNIDFASELLIKRQNNYSGRRHTVMMNEL